MGRAASLSPLLAVARSSARGGRAGLEALLARFQRHGMPAELVAQGGQHLQLEESCSCEAKRVKSDGGDHRSRHAAGDGLFGGPAALARVDHHALDLVEPASGRRARSARSRSQLRTTEP